MTDRKKYFSFSKSVFIEASMEELYQFHADTNNLPRISPSFPKVGLIHVSKIPLEKGDTVHVRIKALLFTIDWHIEISEAAAPVLISDLQTEGPFRYWHHYHRFESKKGGVMMTDQIEFLPPGGYAGYLLLPFIFFQLWLMFSIRHKKTKRVFTAD